LGLFVGQNFRFAFVFLFNRYGAWVKKYIRVIGNKNIYIGIPKEDKKETKKTKRKS